MILSTIIRTVGASIGVFCIFLTESAEAQCSGGNPYQTMVSTSTMVGSGNNGYALPMFDPSLGTLYSVSVSSKFYSYYSYTLTNTDITAGNYNVIINRIDTLQASSPSNSEPVTVLDENNASNPKLIKYISPGTGVPPGATDYNLTIFNGKVITETFDQNVVPFMGSDSLYLTYKTFTEAGGYGNPNISLSNQITRDSVIVTLMYNFCPAEILASGEIELNGSQQFTGLLLYWNSKDNFMEGSYELLKSNDGKIYTVINRQTSNSRNGNNYHYLYQTQRGDGDKAFFRVKRTGKNGTVIYSKVHTAVLKRNGSFTSTQLNTGFNVYPTTTSGIVHLSLPGSSSDDDWYISIFSFSGQLLQQSNVRQNAGVTISLSPTLPNGLHVVNARNKRTNEDYKAKIIVNR
ncbi:MAG: hypothetical protein H7Y03_04335 [Chitinophagaceae bacterium]|nr:hypothetical protein [Chitinophagaceae bacterium]